MIYIFLFIFLNSKKTKKENINYKQNKQLKNKLNNKNNNKFNNKLNSKINDNKLNNNNNNNNNNVKVNKYNFDNSINNATKLSIRNKLVTEVESFLFAFRFCLFIISIFTVFLFMDGRFNYESIKTPNYYIILTYIVLFALIVLFYKLYYVYLYKLYKSIFISQNIIKQDEIKQNFILMINNLVTEIEKGKNNLPIGVMFQGTTGCGKTSLALEVQNYIHWNNKNNQHLIFNGNEYSGNTEENYNNAMEFFKSLDHKNLQIVIFDEFHKACKEIRELCHILIDTGQIDNQIKYNKIFIFITNTGQEHYYNKKENETLEEIHKKIHKDLEKVNSVETISRFKSIFLFDYIELNLLSSRELNLIFQEILEEYSNNGFIIQLDNNVTIPYDSKFGIRNFKAKMIIEIQKLMNINKNLSQGQYVIKYDEKNSKYTIETVMLY